MAPEPPPAHETPQFQNAVEYIVAITFTVAGGARQRTADRRAERVAERLANAAARAANVVEVAAVTGPSSSDGTMLVPGPPPTDPATAQGWPAPLSPLVGSPRDRPQAGALPTDVDRFRELVWEALATIDPSGRRWLAALGGFELLRHGAAEPSGILHATGRSIASMLGIAETTWCRSTRQGQAGHGPLLEAAGLLVREDWERYRLPAWESLQNRAPDATLRGRFVYTHRPTFRDTVVRWRLAGVRVAALGAWSLLRYCHTRWDTAELPLCDAAIARQLGVKPHTWAAWASELAGCGALQRLRPTPGSGYRLPLYFVLRTGRGLDQALAGPVDSVVDERSGARVDPAEAAVQLHATSADPHAEPAAGLSEVRARRPG